MSTSRLISATSSAAKLTSARTLKRGWRAASSTRCSTEDVPARSAFRDDDRLVDARGVHRAEQIVGAEHPPVRFAEVGMAIDDHKAPGFEVVGPSEARQGEEST
jgi:hypothetical protein